MPNKTQPVVVTDNTTRVLTRVIEVSGATVTESAGRAVITITGGGGTSDHALLSHLAWSASAHTGTASRIAGFDGTGAAAYLTGSTVVGYVATTAGDLVYGDGAGGATRLPIGSVNRLLSSSGTAPQWSAPSDVRALLDLEIGIDVQAYDAGLTSLTAADASAGLPYVTGANTWASATYSGMFSVVSGAWKVVGLRESGGTDLSIGGISGTKLLGVASSSIGGVTVGTGLSLAAGTLSADTFLSALSALSSTGLMARTGAGTVAARTLTGGPGVTITNGSGISGNPIISVDSSAPFYVTTTRIYYAQVENNSPVFVGATGAVTLAGTTTVAASVTNTYNSAQITCTNANSSWASRTAFLNVRIGHNPLFVGQFISAAATGSHRVWLTIAVSIGTGSTPSGQSCGLVYDPGVSANWQAFSYDGATISYTDTGVTYAIDTRYQWAVRTTSSSLYVKIWDATGSEPSEVSHTTNLPAAGTNLYPGLVLFLRTAAGSSVFKYLSQQCSMTVNNA
jgi:hypothetical protein